MHLFITVHSIPVILKHIVIVYWEYSIPSFCRDWRRLTHLSLFISIAENGGFLSIAGVGNLKPVKSKPLSKLQSTVYVIILNIKKIRVRWNRSTKWRFTSRKKRLNWIWRMKIDSTFEMNNFEEDLTKRENREPPGALCIQKLGCPEQVYWKWSLC